MKALWKYLRGLHPLSIAVMHGCFGLSAVLVILAGIVYRFADGVADFFTVSSCWEGLLGIAAPVAGIGIVVALIGDALLSDKR